MKRQFLIAIALVLVFLALRELCAVPPDNEKYAPQVMHGVVGGIAGPILDPALYDYDAPRYPLPANRRAEPTVLWSMPPEPPA